MIIGLSGYAQSGKDTIGSFLVKEHGFVRFAFADALKEVVYRLNPIVQTEINVDDLGEYVSQDRVRDIVDTYGWEMAKRVSEVRRLLQVMGTEAGRQVLGENIWVDTVLNQVGDQDAVITDCRFPNEAQAVKDRGGFVVRVMRDGVDAVNAHPSETSLDNWPFDMMFRNDAPLDSTGPLVTEMYDHLKNLHSGLQLF